jgi:hypothetical protein
MDSGWCKMIAFVQFGSPHWTIFDPGGSVVRLRPTGYGETSRRSARLNRARAEADGSAVGFYKSCAGRAEGSNYVDVRAVPEFTLGLPIEAEETSRHSYEAVVAMALREP